MTACSDGLAKPCFNLPDIQALYEKSIATMVFLCLEPEAMEHDLQSGAQNTDDLEN